MTIDSYEEQINILTTKTNTHAGDISRHDDEINKLNNKTESQDDEINKLNIKTESQDDEIIKLFNKTESQDVEINTINNKIPSGKCDFFVWNCYQRIHIVEEIKNVSPLFPRANGFKGISPKTVKGAAEMISSN